MRPPLIKIQKTDSATNRGRTTSRHCPRENRGHSPNSGYPTLCKLEITQCLQLHQATGSIGEHSCSLLQPFVTVYDPAGKGFVSRLTTNDGPSIIQFTKKGQITA